jgi:hypothetical protein
MEGNAIFSADKKFRYVLYRYWNMEKPIMTFVGLNASSAGRINNDPTVWRLIGFADRWGCGRLCVVNLSAYINIHPPITFPIDHENEDYLRIHLEATDYKRLFLVGWGANGTKLLDRIKLVLSLIKDPMCLGITKSGQPVHPLYIPWDRKLIPYELPEVRK